MRSQSSHVRRGKEIVMTLSKWACVVGLLAAGELAAAGLAGREAAALQDPVKAERVATERIAAADLQADLALLRRVFEEMHPGLYRANTREQMAANFAELQASVSRDLTRREAFVLFSQFTAKIRCGHTFANPSNQSKAIRAELFMNADRVPFCFRWVDGRMIVTRDFSGHALMKPGTEVLAINATPVATILERLMTIARADGSNDAKRVSLLEVSGSGRFETFDIFFPLFFPVRGGTYELKVRALAKVGGAGDGAVETVTVAAQTYEGRQAAQKKPGAESEVENGPMWKLSFLADGTAYLPMESWVAYKTTWDWVKFINDSFDTLIEKKTANLVIDLRGNEGGSDVGNVILARLIEKAAPLSGDQRFVRYLKTAPELDAALDTWDSSFRDWSKEAVGPIDLADRATGLPRGTTGGFYRLKEEGRKDGGDSIEMLEPVGKRFAGRVFVLVDATNSSATFQFAAAVKSLGLGTLVGQPTGGNLRGINGGAFFFVRLPRTGFEVDLPIMARYPRVGEPARPDGGIVPDVVVKPTDAGIAAGEDEEMAAVRLLIERQGGD